MKYMGRRFSDMDGIQFNAATTGLMAKITAVTGWRIPDGEGTKEYITTFNDQLKKYVHETCADMTLAEFEYCLRKYGVDTSDWGKPMHLGLLASCVSSYKLQRAVVSELEERVSIDQKHPKKEGLVSGAVDWSEEWRKVVYGAKIGQIKNVWITTDLYDWLIREKKMEEPTPADKWATLKEVAAQYLADIKDALLSGTGTEPTFEIKRRITLLENTDAPIWKKDTVIMSTLAIMAKKELVRQTAIFEALNESE